MRTRVLTLRRVLVAWTILSVAGWFVLGGIGEQQEAECRASQGWFCFDPGVVFILAAIAMAVAWLVGALVITLAWKLGESVRSRRLPQPPP